MQLVTYIHYLISRGQNSEDRELTMYVNACVHLLVLVFLHWTREYKDLFIESQQSLVVVKHWTVHDDSKVLH